MIERTKIQVTYHSQISLPRVIFVFKVKHVDFSVCFDFAKSIKW